MCCPFLIDCAKAAASSCFKYAVKTQINLFTCLELSGMRCVRLLSSGQVLPSECVCGLVELAGDPNTSPTLTGTIISLLAQLGTHTLAHRLSDEQHVRYLSSLSSPTPQYSRGECLHVSIHFVSFVYPPSSQSHNDDITMPCLGLMANLVRYNLSVQTHIKALSNVKVFYRTLINFLAHNSLTVVVFALSILASLTLNEDVGEKLFHAKNIHQTFQLIFNIIVNGDGTLTRKYSVDLLVDLLKNPKMADYLTRYEHFSVCVSQVLGLLHVKDPDSAAKVLELLLALCGVSGLRSLLCEVVFRPAAPRLRAASRRQGAGLDAGQKTQPGLALIQWLSSPAEGEELCCLQALQLLTELLEEALGSQVVSVCVLGFVELLVPVVLDLLQGLDPAAPDSQLRTHCIRTTHTTSLLLNILYRCVCVRAWCVCVCVCVCVYVCHVCSEAVLKAVELMSKLRQQVKDMETSFYRILQDQRMVTPLSLALTSSHREHVQTGLRLLLEATPLPDFPSLVLGESIAANNAYRQREAELSVKRVAVQQDVPAPMGKSLSGRSPSSPSHSIHSLIEKLQNGMELQDQMKDVRVSEIMDVYEQKISSLASKEGRLQDLLEAKALALSQADRLITQYRCQRAQAEAEARKLASMLKEAEQRREELQAELGSQVLEAERAKGDIEELLQHNARLQADSQEHQSLKGSYNQLFNESERLLKELQAAHISLTKQMDTLRKTQDTLRLQHDKGRAKEKEREELEETVDILRKELNKTELARKDASIRASSLELQKAQVEAKLQKKEDELNKHSSMIAMIHSLSSGKQKSDVNLSL
uniref:Cellular inhibitor of PP2A n=1 Tax=Salmo trutta TaxID=8032 RepID=A0A674D1J2_SALTR